jgi:hypothetical protein
MSEFLTQTTVELPKAVLVVGEEEVYQALQKTSLEFSGLEVEVVREQEWENVDDRDRVWRWVWLTDLVEIGVTPAWLEWLYQVGRRAHLVVLELPKVEGSQRISWWQTRAGLGSENVKKLKSYLKQASFTEVSNPETNLQWWWHAWADVEQRVVQVVGEGIGFVSLTSILTSVLVPARVAGSEKMKSNTPDWPSVVRAFGDTRSDWSVTGGGRQGSESRPGKNKYSAELSPLVEMLERWADANATAVIERPVSQPVKSSTKPATSSERVSAPPLAAVPARISFEPNRRGTQKTPRFNFLSQKNLGLVHVRPTRSVKFEPIYVPKIENAFLRSNQWRELRDHRVYRQNLATHINPQFLARTQAYTSDPQSLTPPVTEALESELRRIMQWSRVAQKSTEITQTVKKRTVIKKKHQRKKWFVVVFASLAGMIGGVGILFGLFFIARYRVWQDILQFHNLERLGRTTRLERNLQLMETQLSVYQRAAPVGWLDSSQYLAHLARGLVSYGQSETELAQKLESIVTTTIRPDGQPVAESSLKAMIQTLQSQQNTSALVLGYLDQPPGGFADADLQNLRQLRHKMGNERVSLLRWEKLVEQAPVLLGLSQRRVYAVALSDDLNHRTGGGEVVGIALLVVSQGKIVDAQFIAASELEQRLRGEVSAPIEVTEIYPEQTTWKLADSLVGWQGVQNAYVLRQYVENAVGIKPDAVALLPLDVFEKFLAASGGVSLAGQTQPVTAENLIERLKLFGLIQSQTDAFLTPLAAGWWSAWQAKPNVAVLSAFDQALQDQRTWFVPTDEREAKVYQDLGVVGGIIQPPCPAQLQGERCLSYTKQWSETNITRNNLSWSMKRHSEEQIKISPDGAHHVLSYTVENKEPASSGVKGEYRAVAEWLLPKEATQASVLIDGVVQQAAIVRPEPRTQKVVVRAPYTVLPGQTRSLQLTYRVPQVMPSSVVVFGWQTAPGMPVWQHDVTLVFDGVTSTALQPPAKTNGQRFQYSFPTNQPFVIAAQLQGSPSRPVVQ